MRALFRYPGSKIKLRDKIIDKLRPWLDKGLEYREPFFGTGSVGFSLMAGKPVGRTYWFNDLDYGIMSLWWSVMQRPRELKRLATLFEPSVPAFEEFKVQLQADCRMQRDCDTILNGFMKLAAHQMSYSGFGEMAGGPIGGQGQDTAKYKIGCRWHPENICKKIDYYSALLLRSNVILSCQDFTTLFNGPKVAAVYLDPPYFVAGPAAYKHSFSALDHERLADTLKQTHHKWVLSYDDVPEIRELYSWAKIETIDASYSIVKPKKVSELLITRR